MRGYAANTLRNAMERVNYFFKSLTQPPKHLQNNLSFDGSDFPAFGHRITQLQENVKLAIANCKSLTVPA